MAEVQASELMISALAERVKEVMKTEVKGWLEVLKWR